MKRNFTWRAEWTDLCDGLQARYKAALLRAVLDYGTYGKAQSLEPYRLNAIFECIRCDIDREQAENGN